MKLGNKKYILSIMIPAEMGNGEICRMESDAPFPAIQKGDLIDPRDWEIDLDKFLMTHNYGDLLVVSTIYHHIVQNKDGSYGDHAIDIFTDIVKKEKITR